MTTLSIPVAVVGAILGFAWVVALAAFVVLLILHGRALERRRAQSPGVAAVAPLAGSPTVTPGPFSRAPEASPSAVTPKAGARDLAISRLDVLDGVGVRSRSVFVPGFDGDRSPGGPDERGARASGLEGDNRRASAAPHIRQINYLPDEPVDVAGLKAVGLSVENDVRSLGHESSPSVGVSAAATAGDDEASVGARPARISFAAPDATSERDA